MIVDETRALTLTDVRGSTSPGALTTRTSSPRCASLTITSMAGFSRLKASGPIAPSLYASAAPPPATATIPTTAAVIHFHKARPPFRDKESECRGRAHTRDQTQILRPQPKNRYRPPNCQPITTMFGIRTGSRSYFIPPKGPAVRAGKYRT